MKKILLLFSAAALASQLSAQVVTVREVPNPVVTTFQSSYPSVTTVEWRKSGTNYEAVYTENKNEMYVVYTPSGAIVERGEGVIHTSVPAPATTYVETKYKGDKMSKVYKIKDADGKTLYKGKLKDGNYLIFDANGNFVREVKVD